MFPSSVPLSFLKEFRAEHSQFGGQKVDSELEKVEINFLAPWEWEIVVPSLLSVEALRQLFYSIYHRLNYLFDYLDYRLKVQAPNSSLDTNKFQAYFSLVKSTFFFWKDKSDLLFFSSENGLEFELKNYKKLSPEFAKNPSYLVYFYFSEPLTLDRAKPKITILKEILAKLGLNNLRFALKLKVNKINNNNEQISPPKISQNKLSTVGKKNNQNSTSQKNSLIKSTLLSAWKGRKIFELGVHTKFSTLDGISSPTDYLAAANAKNYAALAVTDHYNVQSFPEFSKSQPAGLKVIYGCEFEMLEDDFSPYIFNHHSELNQQLLAAPITDLTYCVFDLETTGFFSDYNEIIEIGYVIYRQGEIIQEKEYLICPAKEIAPEVLANWYTDIDPQDLKKSPPIQEILSLLQKDWQGCILVAHNSYDFDYGFLNKVWKEHLGEELPHPMVDTLSLAWILLPERKSYSLERLSQITGRGRILQTHRALDDSRLLTELLKKLLSVLQEKEINYWKEVKALIRENHFPDRGHKIKVLVRNQAGLSDLYRLITLSHTQRLFKVPCVLRSDLVKYRKELLIGAAGGREGEIFTLFSAFNSPAKRKIQMRFYDYIEINSPQTFCYLWLSGKIRQTELQNMLSQIIRTAEELNLPLVASHNVHYCQKKEKLLKEIIVANEGMNGTKHYLYHEATGEGKKESFANLPTQHLLNLEEMIDQWLFLNRRELIERLIFKSPQQLVNQISEVKIQPVPLDYSRSESTQQAERELIQTYTNRANQIFGSHWPDFVQQRITQEWKIVQGRYVFIYWLTYKIVQKTHQDGFLVGSRGSVGSSFLAYLCNITDLNPLPFYKFCQKCRYAELYQTKDKTYSCYDYAEKENCPHCSSRLTMEGHNLPFETFFGWEGEKTPDIDLNFSGEYQKTAHNYVRQLLGEEAVYRIGTINTLSQQTAEIFWREHLKLRQKFNPEFSEAEWYKEWTEKRELQELEKKLRQLRAEKKEWESKLKQLEKE
ncbi:MAG: PHP domain-containing protein [Candidatus Moeniiplasma glomeromycotorum]|nr:PHP domain-containing protein [Candidatus Moeniiplasma glomeromycotorum]MCE8162295.1 PHP domain-containing protein [Candidatus Moeniiplasma glomeromycotorum]MCE8166219.1 PHP domain-containing protein [Candidatus Moeniiplasma glomeromycotorum]MCE8166701.1 PHP domain-containing protein [Candidatus Moeniiplasma glomeromycotorum]